jgi:hypothetical protein
MDYSIPIEIPTTNIDFKFTISHKGGRDCLGGNNYILYASLPNNVTIRPQNCHSNLRSPYNNEYELNSRTTYEIHVNDKLTYRLVPTVQFEMAKNQANYYSVVDHTDFFTYEQFDNVTACLTTTSKFDNFVLSCDGNDCHKYDHCYYLPVEHQSYRVYNPAHVDEDDYRLFQTINFKLCNVN